VKGGGRGSSSVQSKRYQTRAIDQETQSHRSRSRIVAVSKHSGYIERVSQRDHQTGDQTKGRMAGEERSETGSTKVAKMATVETTEEAVYGSKTWKI